MNWNDYIVYVDESGDHSLESINSEYPIFVLACCIFHKDEYSRLVAPTFQQFKFKQWGHDMVIFHERKIRQQTHDFSFLANLKQNTEFMEKLNQLIETTPLNIIASVINKNSLKNSNALHTNPYELALKNCLEELWLFLCDKQQSSKTVHFIVESRGKKEDKELTIAFQKICSGNNCHHKSLPIELIFSRKDSNAAGLQFADLFARPIGRYHLDPNQMNRAYKLIKPKLYRNTTEEAKAS